MDIEITYNPYITKTEISIDGTRVDGEYGALFPVRNFPMQCWLSKNGSWPGGAATIAAVARGSAFKLRFLGRNEDYADFYKGITSYQWGHSQLQDITHEVRFATDDISARVDEICSTIVRTWDKPYIGTQSKKDNRIISTICENVSCIKNADEVLVLQSDNLIGQRDVVKENNQLCLVPCSKSNSCEAVRFVDACRSMKRCAESIVFFEQVNGEKSFFGIDSDRQIEELSSEQVELLRVKYGCPYRVFLRLSAARTVSQGYGEIVSSETALRKELSIMKQSSAEGDLPDDTDDSDYERILSCAKWIKENKERIAVLQSLIAKVWG